MNWKVVNFENVLLQALAPSWKVPLSQQGRGGGIEISFVNLEFRGFYCRLFFLASEERVPKQLKQVSIVGIRFTAPYFDKKQNNSPEA